MAGASRNRPHRYCDTGWLLRVIHLPNGEVVLTFRHGDEIVPVRLSPQDLDWVLAHARPINDGGAR